MTQAPLRFHRHGPTPPGRHIRFRSRSAQSSSTRQSAAPASLPAATPDDELDLSALANDLSEASHTLAEEYASEGHPRLAQFFHDYATYFETYQDD